MAKKPNPKNISRPVTSGKSADIPPLAEGKGMSLNAKIAIFLGVIACIIYCNTLSNGYVLDDFTVIKNNSIVTKGVSAIGEIFTTPYRRGWFITNNDLYRPLSLVMFAVEWSMAKGSPYPGHLMNILVFAGGVMLLFLFLDELFEQKKKAVAFIAALLFALHPIHTEVVANIKSRDELLCFFFAFLSLNIFLRYVKSGKMAQLVLGAFCFLLSFLSKETVITFVAVIPFIFFFYRNEDKKRSLFITIASVVTAVIFLAIRYSVLSNYGANTSSHVSFMDNMLTKAPSAASALATEILILGNYVKLLFVPYPLICDYSYNSIPFATFANIGVIISLLLYVFLAVYSVIRLIKNKKDPYAFGIIFFLITISLFSNIPFLIGAAMAERFVFFASVGFCLLIGLVIEQLLMAGETSVVVLKKAKILAVLVPLCLIYAGIATARNNDWLDNVTLFKADVVNAPNDARVNYYLGTEMVTEMVQKEGNPVVRRQLLDEGMVYLKKALVVYPDYDDAHAALGDAYFKIGVYDSAELHDKRALELNPKFVVAINNLAGVYFMGNRYDEAIQICRKALELNPKFVNAYSNMGLCYLRKGQFDSSLKNLYKAIDADPNFISSYENMSLTYRAMGKIDSVKKYEEIVRNKKSGN